MVFHNLPKMHQASCVLKMAKFKAFHEMAGNFTHFAKCLSESGFREMPKDSRHFTKCLITQFACNMYVQSIYPIYTISLIYFVKGLEELCTK